MSVKEGQKLPEFETTAEEAAFWDTHSFADYMDEFERVKEPVFVRPPKKVISLRLDRQMVDMLEMIAREKEIPYTTLVRMWVKEKLAEELSKRAKES